MAKIVYQETDRRIVEDEKGNVKHTELSSRSVKRVSGYEEFMQVYLQDIAPFYGLTQLTEFKVLLNLWKRATFNPVNRDEGNIIYLYSPQKREIAEETGLSYNTVHAAVNRLAKKDFIISKARGVYLLNPEICFKGQQDDRPKVIKKVLEYRIAEKSDKKDPNQIDLFDGETGEVVELNANEEGKQEFEYLVAAE